MGAAVAAVLMKERLIVTAFERLQATSLESARTPEELGVDAQGLGWHRLRERAVIRESGQGRFYLDIEVWQATRRTRRRMLFVVAVAMLTGVLLLMLRRWRA
jgi:hypothetical protein